MNKLLNIIGSNPSASIILRKIFELNFRKQKNIIGKYFTTDKNESMLDLGSGTGEFSTFFPAENYVGIDIDEQNINYAKAHYQKKFQIADARKLPLEDNSFDKILTILSILHITLLVQNAVKFFAKKGNISILKIEL